MSKVLILIPTKDKVETACLEAAYGQNYDNFSVMVNRRAAEPTKNKFQNIVTNRIELQERALKTDAEWFLWLDYDVIMPNNTISIFMDNPKPIMGAWCPMGNGWNIGTVKDGVLKNLDTYSPVEIPVNHIGFGALMVSREVMEKIKIRYSFDEKCKSYEGYVSKCECFAFCEDAEKLGYEVIAKPIICEHNRNILASMTIIELKAFWLDQILQIEQSQKKLMSAQNEISKRKK